ncbi:MAG: hypothetical protein J0L92_37145 [Deltaproteobacteria bacterium]|nr:hypothetical protein [Deltaproteobacteria bacterium]
MLDETGDDPSQASIDALFRDATTARVRASTRDARDPTRGPVLLEVGASDLEALARAVRIRETGERFRCMCLGDLAIEVVGPTGGAIRFHHGSSLSLTSWCSDARLEDGAALLHVLAQRGVPGPLAAHEAKREEARERREQRAQWLAAVPHALVEMLAELEEESSDPAVVEAALARLRATADHDAMIARVLLAWLAHGELRWTGYPSYEGVPLALLRALPMRGVVEAAMDPALDDASTYAFGRFVSHWEIVRGRRSSLAEVPDALFARMRGVVARVGDEDALRRLDHAARLAAEVRG